MELLANQGEPLVLSTNHKDIFSAAQKLRVGLRAALDRYNNLVMGLDENPVQGSIKVSVTNNTITATLTNKRTPDFIVIDDTGTS